MSEKKFPLSEVIVHPRYQGFVEEVFIPYLVIIEQELGVSVKDPSFPNHFSCYEGEDGSLVVTMELPPWCPKKVSFTGNPNDIKVPTGLLLHFSSKGPSIVYPKGTWVYAKDVKRLF